MNNENGVARIAVIIVVMILVVGALVYLNRNNEFEKVENEVTGYVNVVADKIEENVNASVESIDTSTRYIVDENGQVNGGQIPEGQLDVAPEIEININK